MQPRFLAAVAAVVVVSACGGPPSAAAISGGNANALRAGVQPDEPMSLHPLSLHFASAHSRAKDAYVRHYGYSGTFNENCFTKGVAEFDGDGLEGKTGVFVAIPMAAGTCQATFHKGAQTLSLRVTVGGR
jgi:hypothetical protein